MEKLNDPCMLNKTNEKQEIFETSAEFVDS